MQPRLESVDSRLVEGRRLNEDLGPVGILLVQYLHVDLQFLHVRVILVEVLSDDIFDLAELPGVLRVQLDSLLVKLVGHALHEVLDPIDPAGHHLGQLLSVRLDSLSHVLVLRPQPAVHLSQLPAHSLLKLLDLLRSSLEAGLRLRVGSGLHALYPLLRRSVVGARFLLELDRVFLEVLQLVDGVAGFRKVVLQLDYLLLHVVLVVKHRGLAFGEPVIDASQLGRHESEQLVVLLSQRCERAVAGGKMGSGVVKPSWNVRGRYAVRDEILQLGHREHACFLVKFSQDVGHVGSFHLIPLGLETLDELLSSSQPLIHGSYSLLEGPLLTQVKMPLSPEDVHDFLFPIKTPLIPYRVLVIEVCPEGGSCFLLVNPLAIARDAFDVLAQVDYEPRHDHRDVVPLVPIVLKVLVVHEVLNVLEFES